MSASMITALGRGARRSAMTNKLARFAPSMAASNTRCFTQAAIISSHPLRSTRHSTAAARMLPSATRAFASRAIGEEFTINVPTMGDSITEGTIVQWIKNEGEYVAEDEAYVVIETDKVSVDIRATDGGGIVKKQMAEEGDTVEVGAPLVTFEHVAAPAKVETPAPVAATPAPAAPAAAAPAPTPTPVAAAPPAPKAPAPKAAAAPVAVMEGERTEERVKMTRMRMRIAERLSEAQSTAVLLTTFNEIDMSALMNMRTQHKELFQKTHGIKLGFMSAFVLAATAGLQQIPAVNAAIDGNDIVYHNYTDISIAVSTPRGLVVPVLRNTHKMGFADVENTIAELGAKAREDKISLEEMTGGTFTITNGGVFGSMMSTPMLNMPQSAILGMHGIKDRPVVVDGEIVIRPMMYVALTYDHRLIDGRESVTFLKGIKEKLEDPTRMLLKL